MTPLKYKTGFRRLAAALIDGIVFMPFLFIEHHIYGHYGRAEIIFVWVVFVTFLPVAYSVIAHFRYGQTIGKWVAGVQVLDKGELRGLTWKQSLFRDAGYIVIEAAALIWTVYETFQTGKHMYVVDAYLEFSNQPVFWWMMLELISMLMNAKRRAVHDWIAGSVVVRKL